VDSASTVNIAQVGQCHSGPCHGELGHVTADNQPPLVDAFSNTYKFCTDATKLVVAATCHRPVPSRTHRHGRATDGAREHSPV